MESPAEFTHLSECHKTVMAFEVARARHYEFRNHPEKLSSAFYGLIETGLSISRADYDAALAARDAGEAALAKLLSSHDAIMTPAAPSGAPAGIKATGDPLFSRLWTLMRVPTVTLPFAVMPQICRLRFSWLGGLAKIRLYWHIQGLSQTISRYPATYQNSTLPLADIILLPRQITQASFIQLAGGARNV